MESSAPFRSKTKLLVAFLGMASVAFLLYQDYCQLPFTTPGTATLGRSHRPPAPDFNITANAAAATTTQVRSIDSFRLNTTTRRDHAHEASSERREVVDVMLVFTRAREFRNLREKFSICLTSMFRRSSAPLHLHIVTDAPSQELAKQVLVDASVGCTVSITVSPICFFAKNKQSKSKRQKAASPPLQSRPPSLASVAGSREKRCAVVWEVPPAQSGLAS